ncbi:MAG TPA: CHASE2 domain-containing protein, partial [Pseudorhizobium sp.]|nr:CHASE2 domain-containing protein [Pseudorhizobium sp.]
MPFALPAMTVVRQMDNALVDLRAKLAPRIASNRFVFAAIDKESLDHVGTWPWPRSVHAAIIDALVDAEARDILLDIDFSTASSPDEDQKLADALARAGGGVLLPVFEQHQRVGDPSTVSLTHPIDLLAANAWPAAVNVVLDQAGRFHGFAAGVALDGVSVPAASVQLAGGQDPGVPLLPVDFSIQPDTVTTISVADLLRGKVDADLLAGRSVVVGAYATELKDFFPVPVYGVLSGPMLNILGAETILQDRVPHRVPVWPFGVLLAVLILVGSQVLRSRRTVEAVALVVAVGASIEVTGYLLQKQWSMQLPSATCQLMLAAGIAILLFEKIGLAAWLLEVASAERRNSRRILKRVISDSTDPIIIVDGRGRILDLSRTAINLFEIPHGLRRGDDFGRWAPAPLTELVDRLRENLSLEEKLLPSVQEEITIHRSGQPLHLEATVTISRLEDGALHGAATFASCITLRDVTARKAYEAKLRRLAQLDDLTGALNRREFVARLAQSLGQGKVMAVGAIDLHRFGTLNSTFGRKAGDVVLSAVSRRLMSGAHRMSIHQEHAFVARLGGDVFCVAVALAEESHLESFPPTLLALLEKPVDARGIKLRLEARVGACIANSASDAGASVDAAEQALDEAKKIGGSGWRLHDPLAAVQQARRMRLEQEMRDALRANQFFLVYQPQVDLVSGAVCGAEALLRWKHPELGLVPPNDF